MTEPTPTPAAKAVGGLTILKNIAKEIATLERPVTAAAVAAFVLTIIPGVGLTVQEATAIIAGVGGLDAALTQVAK
jgi:hypothetical protein